MAVLLVTYDLNKLGQDYSDFIDTFKNILGLDCQNQAMLLKLAKARQQFTKSLHHTWIKTIMSM